MSRAAAPVAGEPGTRYHRPGAGRPAGPGPRGRDGAPHRLPPPASGPAPA
jgi:hypothetical protein